MRIGLICPAEERNRVRAQGERPKLSRQLRSNRISLMAIAAATPQRHELRFIDEYVEPVDYDEHLDLVGISFMTALAPRAYEIAAEFRRRGVTVIFGGYHPTFMPDEAIEHCDALCVGEGELVWPRILEDSEQGTLQRVYRSEEPLDLAHVPFLRRDILEAREYVSTNLLLAGRGCPHRCDFCSVTSFFCHTYRHRPVESIVQEIWTMPGDLVLFGDDDIVADRRFARRLFQALRPLRRRWISQANLSIAEDDDLLLAAARSGCIGLFIGFESLSDRNLQDMGKDFYRMERYAGLIRKLNRRGIAVMGGFMFGFDHDDKGVFERTARFMKAQRLVAAQVSIVTPFPGTPLYSRMEREGRIFCKDWTKYDFRHVVFTPSQMSPAELEQGADWVIGEFYRTSSILRRLFHNCAHWGARQVIRYGLPLNIAYKRNLAGEPRAS